MAVITWQQTAFLEAFGFLRIEGLFAEEIKQVTEAFEGLPRPLGPDLVARRLALSRLPQDDRIHGIARSVLGDDVECAQIVGDAAKCRRGWHTDDNGGSVGERHIKISLVLDAVRAKSGAVRVIPGTHLPGSSYAQDIRRLLREFGEPRKAFGVDHGAIPATIIDANPGDVLAWNCHLIHASFNGADRCPLFSVGFRVPPATSRSER